MYTVCVAKWGLFTKKILHMDIQLTIFDLWEMYCNKKKNSLKHDMCIVHMYSTVSYTYPNCQSVTTAFPGFVKISVVLTIQLKQRKDIFFLNGGKGERKKIVSVVIIYLGQFTCILFSIRA